MFNVIAIKISDFCFLELTIKHRREDKQARIAQKYLKWIDNDEGLHFQILKHYIAQSRK